MITRLIARILRIQRENMDMAYSQQALVMHDLAVEQAVADARDMLYNDSKFLFALAMEGILV